MRGEHVVSVKKNRGSVAHLGLRLVNRAVGAAASDAWTGPTACLGKIATNSQIWASSAWTYSPHKFTVLGLLVRL